MVAGVAEKLAENPSDKQGWNRLIQSYMVLGKTDDARNAIETARRAHADDPDFLANIKALQEKLQ